MRISSCIFLNYSWTITKSSKSASKLRAAFLLLHLHTHNTNSRILVSGSFNSWMWLVCFWSNTSTVLERHMKSVHRWTWGNIGSLNTGRMLFELFWNHFYFLAPLNFNLLKKQLMPPHMEVQYRVALKGGVHCTLLLSIKIMLLVGGPWASKLTNLLGFICILGGWLPYNPFNFWLMLMLLSMNLSTHILVLIKLWLMRRFWITLPWRN